MTANTVIPISTQARGHLRTLWAAASADDARMRAAAARIPPDALDGSRWKGQIGSKRAILKIIATMPRDPDLHGDRLALWRWLSPLPAVPHAPGAPPEVAQPCIAVVALIARHRMPRRGVELFGTVATAHALGRLLDRSGFQANPAAAILQANDALLALPPAEGDGVFGLDAFPLPAAGGLFLTRVRHVGTGASPLAVCRTWVHVDQTHPHQAADLSAWGRLLDRVPA